MLYATEASILIMVFTRIELTTFALVGVRDFLLDHSGDGGVYGDLLYSLFEGSIVIQASAALDDRCLLYIPVQRAHSLARFSSFTVPSGGFFLLRISLRPTRTQSERRTFFGSCRSSAEATTPAEGTRRYGCSKRGGGRESRI